MPCFKIIHILLITGLMMSIIDGAGTTGYVIGPLFGGILFQLFGFLWCFLTVGILGLILGLFAGLVLSPTEYSKEEKSTNWLTYLRYYKVIFSCLILTNGFVAAFYFENIMPLYLKQFGVTPIIYGGVMVGFNIIFASTTVMWTYFGQKPKLIPFIVLSGLFTTAVLLLFIGPAQFLHLPANSVGVILAIYIIYAGTTTVFATQYVNMNSYLEEVGLHANLATKSMVSSITLFVLAIGIIISLPLSGYLYELYDFSATTTILAFIQFGMGFIFVVYYAIHYVLEKKKIK